MYLLFLFLPLPSALPTDGLGARTAAGATAVAAARATAAAALAQLQHLASHKLRLGGVSGMMIISGGAFNADLLKSTSFFLAAGFLPYSFLTGAVELIVLAFIRAWSSSRRRLA